MFFLLYVFNKRISVTREMGAVAYFLTLAGVMSMLVFGTARIIAFFFQKLSKMLHVTQISFIQKVAQKLRSVT